MWTVVLKIYPKLSVSDRVGIGRDRNPICPEFLDFEEFESRSASLSEFLKYGGSAKRDK